MPHHRAALAILILHIATAATVTGLNQAKFRTFAGVEPNLNSTALELFERSRRSYERTYPQYGRILSEMASDSLTLDFEIETCARVRMTPQLLLQRGGIDIELAQTPSTSSSSVQDKDESYMPLWPKVSEWFSLGIDGTGRFVDQLFPNGNSPSLAKRLGKARRSYRQDLSGQIELESILMRPSDVIHSNFIKDLESFMTVLSLVNKSHVEYWSKRGKAKQKTVWYRLPFNGSRGIHIFGAVDPAKPCDVCHVQWTVGLSLRQVPKLLQLSPSAPLQEILSRTGIVCARHAHGCAPEYQALISLAGWLLNTAKRCIGCSHPKRCMSPWLVRTHFGDLAMHVKEKLGPRSLDNFRDDVLEIGQVSGKDAVLPDGGPIDYLRLPEMAELGGVVAPRSSALRSLHGGADLEDMPSDVAGLLKLSAKMIKNSKVINQRLRRRACKLHSRTSQGTLKVADWLEGLLHGKDLMSDHDSPLSQSSFSHLIWKSMGSWRMKPGSDRVYLECRSTKECLRTAMHVGAPSLIQFVGHQMYDFEKKLKEETAKAARQRTASLQHWSRGGSHGASTFHGTSRRAARRAASAARLASEAGRRAAEIRAQGQVRSRSARAGPHSGVSVMRQHGARRGHQRQMR